MSEPLFRLVASKTHEVDRADALRMAHRHASLPESPTERDLDRKHVEKLTDRFKGGLMIPCCWATVKFQGRVYRINGHHSSEGMLAAGEALPPRVVIHFDEYEIDEPEGMAVLFRQFDGRLSMRDSADVAGAYQGLVPELEGITRATGKLGVEGIDWHLRVIEEVPVRSGDDKYSMFLVPVYYPFLHWLSGVISVKTPELKRTSIIGAMYETFLKSESGAVDFWSAVARGGLTDDDAPATVLSRGLVEIKETKGQPPPKPGQIYAQCIKAWNAFRSGEKLRSLVYNLKKGLPVAAA